MHMRHGSLLGIDMPGVQQQRGDKPQGGQPQESGAKKLLKGLFREH